MRGLTRAAGKGRVLALTGTKRRSGRCPRACLGLLEPSAGGKPLCLLEHSLALIFRVILLRNCSAFLHELGHALPWKTPGQRNSWNSWSLRESARPIERGFVKAIAPPTTDAASQVDIAICQLYRLTTPGHSTNYACHPSHERVRRGRGVLRLCSPLSQP